VLSIGIGRDWAGGRRSSVAQHPFMNEDTWAKKLPKGEFGQLENGF